MSAFSSAPPSHGARTRSVVPFVIFAAILCGVGLFGMSFWLVTLDWVYFASLIPLILGAYLLFTRGTGPDHA